MDKVQRSVDKFYINGGKKPCCAGCDWWRFYNSMIGECTKSAPVSGHERWNMVGITGLSCEALAGHIMTPRDHSCGEFIDAYEW